MEFTRASDSSDEREPVPLPLPPPNDDDRGATSSGSSCLGGRSLVGIGSSSAACRRLWIGNLDSSITEYGLLKVVERYGPLEKFDFMYHLAPGSNRGKPRGYCFVTYVRTEDARLAQRSLDGLAMLSRRLTVRVATSTAPAQPRSGAERVGLSSGAPPQQPAAVNLDPAAKAGLKRKLIADVEEQLRRMSAEQQAARDDDASASAKSRARVVPGAATPASLRRT